MIAALLLLTALWLGTGAAVVRLVLARRAHAEAGLSLLARAALAARAAGALLVAGGLTRVGTLAWAMAEDEPLAPMLAVVARDTLPGRLALALAGSGLALLVAPRRLLPLATPLAMLAAAGLLAASGHAGELPPVAWWGGLDVLHALAASAWLGALAVVLPMLRRADGARVLSGFAPVALTGAALTLATGVARAWHVLPTVGALLTEPWGRWLLAKSVGVLVLLALGWRNWRAHRGRASLDSATSTALERRATLEVVVAFAVLAVTAALTTTAPPEAATP